VPTAIESVPLMLVGVAAFAALTIGRVSPLAVVLLAGFVTMLF